MLVIQTIDPQILANFYSLLGLKFEYHQHSKGPLHYTTTIDKTVFEIYPLRSDQVKPDSTLRLGFQIRDFDQTLATLLQHDVKILSKPTSTDWGTVALIQDPDGRKIELYKKEV